MHVAIRVGTEGDVIWGAEPEQFWTRAQLETLARSGAKLGNAPLMLQRDDEAGWYVYAVLPFIAATLPDLEPGTLVAAVDGWTGLVYADLPRHRNESR